MKPLLLASFLAASSLPAWGAQVSQSAGSSVWATRDGWSIAVNDPQTTTDAFRAFVAQSPDAASLTRGLQKVYADRTISIDASSHTVRVSDAFGRVPITAAEYLDATAYRTGQRPSAVPEIPTTTLPDVPRTTLEEWKRAGQPVAVVHASPLASGRPSLVCDVSGAVAITAWGPQKDGDPLRQMTTVPVDGVKVVLVDVERGLKFNATTDSRGRYTVNIPMTFVDKRILREVVYSNGEPIDGIPRLIAVCHV